MLESYACKYATRPSLHLNLCRNRHLEQLRQEGQRLRQKHLQMSEFSMVYSKAACENTIISTAAHAEIGASLWNLEPLNMTQETNYKVTFIPFTKLVRLITYAFNQR